MKINADFSLLASAKFSPKGYVPSPAYGVNRFMLDRIGEEKARATTIVEYQPNSKFPRHTHAGGEEFVVLKGAFKDEFGAFPAGTYVRNPIGSQHAPWVDDDGCTIFVKLLQMAEPEKNSSDDTPAEAPLYVDCRREKGSSDGSGGVVVQDLYSNGFTGERVQMCWLDANQPFEVGDKGVTAVGGEELFVYEGSLLLNDNDEYGQWSWIRFPANDDAKEKNGRSTLRAGPLGAQVYRKTGHLTEKAISMEKKFPQD